MRGIDPAECSGTRLYSLTTVMSKLLADIAYDVFGLANGNGGAIVSMGIEEHCVNASGPIVPTFVMLHARSAKAGTKHYQPLWLVGGAD